MCLHYDLRYGNRNIEPEFKDGYYGKFNIDFRSNMRFFANLIEDDPEKIDYLAELILIKEKADED